MKKISELGGLGGAMRPELTPNGKHNHARMMMSPTSDADSLFAKSMGRLVGENDEEDDEIEEYVLKESQSLDIVRLVIDLVQGGADLGTAETYGMGAMIPRIAYNVAHLYFKNKFVKGKIEEVISMTMEMKKGKLINSEVKLLQKRIKGLQALRREMGHNIVNVVSSITSAFPIPVIGNLADIVMTQTSDKASASIAQKILSALDSIDNEGFKKLIIYGGSPIGMPIIKDSLEHIIRMDQILERVPKEEEFVLREGILSTRVKRGRKFCLVETLERIKEYPDYAGQINSKADMIRNSSNQRINDINEEDFLEEFSGAAAGGGGPAVPLGYTAKGKPETPRQRRKRQHFNITKSYPYTNLAQKPRSTKKRRKKRK